MAQHDFVIANQGFPATRADINNFLQAVATTHSGTSTPSGAVAGTIWLDTTTATAPILKYYDGTDNITLATIDHVANTVNFSDSALDLITDTTPQLGGNLDVNGNSIVSTSNANITLAPNGTGDVVLSADTVKIGDANANATITTDGTGDLILNTNSGSSSGSITIADGANADITIAPNGTGDILLDADTVRVGDSGANATITSNGAGDLILNTNSGTNSGSITIADGANGNITIAGNGTGQIVVNAGAVGTPTIAPTGDTNTGIFFPSADTIAFTEGGTEAMRIDSSGNVGIGTTSGNEKLNVFGAGKFTGNAVTLDQTGAYIDYSSGIARISGQASTGGTLTFLTNPNAGFNTERMRIDSSGNVFVGATAFPSTGIASFGIESASTYKSMQIGKTFSGTIDALAMYHNGSKIGSVTYSNTNAAYNTSSDYRLKENVNYNFDATTRLKQLKPARFNFIVEPNRTVDGFLAHEVQDIIPEAITGIKDQVEAIGNITDVEGKVIRENVTEPSELPENQTWTQTGTRPVYQGIDQAKLTPLLTKALQEAIAKIEQLEARLTALES